MCGVWISIGLQDPSAAIDYVAHRGPDGAGRVDFATAAGPLILGHRRLAIYDLESRSAQPMMSASGDRAIVFNGAIYNFRTLRSELEKQGVAFRTQSDTEVLLEAMSVWGTAALDRLNGMFAFAFWDARRKKLILARDRFGEKPLYVHASRRQGTSIVLFASEIGQILSALPGATIDVGAAGDFLNYAAVDWSGSTFIRNVKRVPAASYVELDLSRPAFSNTDELVSRARRFWTPPTVDRRLSDPHAAAEAMQPLWSRAIKLRLAADVTVGACLSGGLDSTLIVRSADTMRKEEDGKLLCVSAVYEDTALDGRSLSERPYVEAAIAGGRFDSRIISPTDKDVADAFDSIAVRQGEPFASASICAQYFVFKAARDAGAKVMLDGQGADELFGGYAGMQGAYFADLALNGRLHSFFKELRAQADGDADLDLRQLLRLTYSSMIPETARRAIGSVRGKWPPKDRVFRTGPPEREPARTGLTRFDALIRRMMSQTSLPALLRYEDRNSMAHGVESRLPFLDSDVSDLAFRLPGSAKVARGDTKSVLRILGLSKLPDLVRNRRRKLGFVTPQDRWMQGALRQPTLEALSLARKDWADLIDVTVLDEIERRLGADAGANAAAFRLFSFLRWSQLFRLSA